MTELDQRAEQAMEIAAQGEGSGIAAAPVLGGMIADPKTMNTLFRLAKMYASSKIVPETYRDKPEDCLVAIELAARMNVSPIFVMQQLYIVKGRPGWSGQAALALIQNARKFMDLEYVMVGTEGTMERGCYLQGRSTTTGRIVKGTLVTMQMAKDEGWIDKSGSKWKTMPEQMLRYRAASFFARAECPQALMGFQTVEELEDVQGRKDAPEVKTVKLTLNSQGGM